MNPELPHQRRLRLRLEADGRDGLYPLLAAAAGACLAERFRLDGLFAVGRQGYIFAATDLNDGAALVVKQPAFDYRDPVRYDRVTVARLRGVLNTEAAVLRACTTGHLPRLLDCVVADAVVPAAREAAVLASNEVFLIEERLGGAALARFTLEVLPGWPAEERERLARNVAREFTAFWTELRAAGWHYADVNADNLILEGPQPRLRVVDGGSAVPAAAMVVLPSFTPAFTTPRLYAALRQRRPVPGSLAAVLPPLAKVLHFLLTGREPCNGDRPDVAAAEMERYSSACRAALAALLDLDDDPERLADGRAALGRWTDG